MQIVTDSAFDTTLSPAELQALNIHILPQWIHFEGKSYRNGVDIQAHELYPLMAASSEYPTTSMPSLGEAYELLNKAKANDPDLLIISVSGELSGTLKAFQEAARHVTGANITIFDSHAFSVMQGWQVESAARVALENWPLGEILAMLEQLRSRSRMIFTLKELRYLQHSGRINHMKGLIGAALKIKPQILMDHVTGKLEQIGLSATFRQSLQALVNFMKTCHEPGTPLKVQCGHTNEPESSAMLRELISKVYPCEWQPDFFVNPVLGALAGPTIAGAVFMPLGDFPAFSSSQAVRGI